ncbi:hypothetical protein QLQ15_03775 [Lysobacter sp. LF1]|uniref:Uncharacterized protein n=1 Tax=Lysobacter stagni TaxID=3045172 RepID=A0ABT6XDB1_9GAMM|nr:hypothetical protein [Lysobacter sp. LF1]MDI9238024.1 hypothetical protein [Lysobacter sp. LF1]
MTHRHRLNLAIAAALFASIAVVGCKKKEEPVATMPPPAEPAPAPTPPPAMPAPAAITVTSVTLGTAAGADKKIAAPLLVFTPKDKIIVSVATDGTASNVDVASRLVFQDGQTAGEMKQALNTTGAETTNFEFTNANPWPAGKYKAEVTVAGAPAQSVDFEVK